MIGVVKMKQIKILTVVTVLVISLVGLSACSNSPTNVTSTKTQLEPNNILQSTDVSSQTTESFNDSTGKSDTNEDRDSDNTFSENNGTSKGVKEEKESLSKYSF